MEQGNNPSGFTEPDPFAERKIFLRQCKPSSKAFSKKDIEFRKYEDYLRSKYDCSEPIPAGFDPETLEAIFQAQRKFRSAHEKLNEMESEVQLEVDPSEMVTIKQRKECEYILNIIYLSRTYSSKE
ncbi:hypothetical protein F5B19DRAFT_192531 [Rostrohypoxylon terebratum]|nr:hypothetical protein F5B19DRAFT_192531 [Rostrohypoxylon terebratum]